jgi:hypothetical protein
MIDIGVSVKCNDMPRELMYGRLSDTARLPDVNALIEYDMYMSTSSTAAIDICCEYFLPKIILAAIAIAIVMSDINNI